MSALATAGAPPRGATLDGPREVFGLIDLGARVIGISARHIREAVPMPQTVSPLPQDCPGLLGAMVLRGETIPLMRFAEALGIAHPETAPGGVVIVLRHEGRILGLVADGLRGMTSVALADCATLGTIGSDAAVDMLTFVHEGRVISTLDPQRVLARPGIPFARDPQAGSWSAELPAAAEAARFDPDDFDPADFDPADFDPDDFEPDPEDDPEGEAAAGGAGTPGGEARLTGQGTAHMLCGYLGHCIAIPAHQIEATLPMSRIEASPLAHGPCRGVVRHHQREVPIVDTLQVLGLGASPAPVGSSAGVILRFPDDGLLALELDRFYDISHFQESTLGRLPAAISERPGYFRGVHLAADGTAFLVTDVTALARESALQGLSQATLELPGATERNRPGQAGGTGMSSMMGRSGTPRPAEGGIGAERLFLILDAAGRLACPIETILEIIRPPPELLAAEARFDGYIGKITHRQELVPIFCIARQRGDWPEFAPEVASILLLQGEDGMTGYLVEQLQSVEPARVLRETAEDPSTTELIELSQTRQLLPVFRPEAGF